MIIFERKMSKLKLWLALLLMLLCLGGNLFFNDLNVHASSRVLLVYDSQNKANLGYQKIDTLQRLLTSININVTTTNIKSYRAGTLRTGNYLGVITMINWPQVKINNNNFYRDRARFSGIKWHIGGALSSSELSGVNIKKVYHQQFTVQYNHREQLLPFTDTLSLVSSNKAKHQSFGSLINQNGGGQRAPFGTIVGKDGYLPYFSTEGVGLLLAEKMMSQLFSWNQINRPLLTISGVTPYSNLTLLNNLTRFLYENNIPFAISTTTVSRNNELPAFSKFTKALRLAEIRNGVVFLKVPEISYKSGSKSIKNVMQKELTNLGQAGVFPVGLGAANFWNQDAVYRKNGLDLSNYVMLFPSPKTVVFSKQDNRATSFKKAIFALSLNNYLKMNPNWKTSLSMPTSITLKLPDKFPELKLLEGKLDKLSFNWYSPFYEKFKPVLRVGSSTFSYNHGIYYLNGKPEEITSNLGIWKTPWQRSVRNKTKVIWINQFFLSQSKILMTLLIVIFIVLLFFVIIGRRMYRKMFFRK